jgi:outer membrane cobalamin receptor
MKKAFQALFSAAVLFLAFPVCALTQERMETRQLDSIRITADRVLKDMGIQKTVIDTLALRESISGSLASVLTQNSTLFIKSYGRATLSTASFRGTAPSHTQVTWNGMKLNSPMLGMVDFSQIPSYLLMMHIYITEPARYRFPEAVWVVPLPCPPGPLTQKDLTPNSFREQAALGPLTNTFV